MWVNFTSNFVARFVWKLPEESSETEECKKWLKFRRRNRWCHVSTWSAKGKEGSLCMLYVTWPAMGEVWGLTLTCTPKLSQNQIVVNPTCCRTNPWSGCGHPAWGSTPQPHRCDCRGGWTIQRSWALNVTGLIQDWWMQTVSETSFKCFTDTGRDGAYWQNFTLGKITSLDCRSEPHLPANLPSVNHMYTFSSMKRKSHLLVIASMRLAGLLCFC